MYLKTLKPLAGHALLAVSTLIASVMTFEWILSIAVQKDDEAKVNVAVAADTLVREEPHRSVSEQSPLGVNASHEVLCKSAFYAVFEDDSDTFVCAQNPTLQMAKWGPPSAAWFRSDGGDFLVRNVDAAPSDLCACLVKQPGYNITGKLNSYEPMDHILFNGMRKPIVKWSCADACTSTTPGEKHGF